MVNEAKYYVVHIDREASCGMIAGRCNWQGFDCYELRRARHVATWPDYVSMTVKFVVEAGYDERLTDYVEIPSPGIPAVSERARDVIRALAPGAAQFLRIDAYHHEKGRFLGTYWVMNTLQVVAALDFEQTRWMGDPSGVADKYAICNILRPALDASRIGGHLLFRLDVNGELYYDRVFASERLKYALTNAEAADGFAFDPVLAA